MIILHKKELYSDLYKNNKYSNMLLILSKTIFGIFKQTKNIIANPYYLEH